MVERQRLFSPIKVQANMPTLPQTASGQAFNAKDPSSASVGNSMASAPRIFSIAQMQPHAKHFHSLTRF